MRRSERMVYFTPNGLLNKLYTVIDNSKTPIQASPTVFFIFGASGDLTSRKLIPALYNLSLDGWLPPSFAIVGMGRSQYSDDQYRDLLLEDINKFSRKGKGDARWKQFASNIYFHISDI